MRKSANLTPILNEFILPFNNFFTMDDLLQITDGSIAMKIITQFDINEEEMADFWSRNINEVNTLISQYRTVAQQQMKLSLYDGPFFYFVCSVFFRFILIFLTIQLLHFLLQARMSVLLGKTGEKPKDFMNLIFNDSFDVEMFYTDRETYVSFLTYIGRHVVRDKHFKSLSRNTSSRDVND